MIEANLRLIVAVAMKHRHRATQSFSLLDMLQEGAIGLATAVDRFDPSRGYKLSTMAYWWIRQAIGRATYHDSRTIRIPTGLLDSMQKVRRATTAFEQEHGERPTIDQLVELTGFRRAIIERGIAAEFSVISADAMLRPGDDEKGVSLGDTLAAPMPEEDDSGDMAWRSEWVEDALTRPGAHSSEEIDAFLGVLAGVPVADVPTPSTTESWRRRAVVRRLHAQAVADGLADPVRDAWELTKPAKRKLATTTAA